MRPQSGVGFGETYLQPQKFGQKYVYVLGEEKGDAGTFFRKTRSAIIRSRFSSIDAHDEENINPEELLTVTRSRTLTVVLAANGEVHTHEEAQVVRSRI